MLRLWIVAVALILTACLGEPKPDDGDIRQALLQEFPETNWQINNIDITQEYKSADNPHPQWRLQFSAAVVPRQDLMRVVAELAGKTVVRAEAPRGDAVVVAAKATASYIDGEWQTQLEQLTPRREDMGSLPQELSSDTLVLGSDAYFTWVGQIRVQATSLQHQLQGMRLRKNVLLQRQGMLSSQLIKAEREIEREIHEVEQWYEVERFNLERALKNVRVDEEEILRESYLVDAELASERTNRQINDSIDADERGRLTRELEQQLQGMEQVYKSRLAALRAEHEQVAMTEREQLSNRYQERRTDVEFRVNNLKLLISSADEELQKNVLDTAQAEQDLKAIEQVLQRLPR